MTRYHLKGGAVATTISGTVNVSGGATITIDDATGWADASVGPFPCVIDEGTSSEEKVLVTARAGTSLTVTAGNRGHDESTAHAHSAGARIRPCITAAMLDEHDAHVASTTLHLGTGNVTGTNLAAGAVTAGKIATGGVSSSTQLAAGVVDTATLGPLAVTQAKVATGFRLHAASSAAPASPSRGDPWLDTDTMESWVYYGATTGWQKPWNMPWGNIGVSTATATQSVSSLSSAVMPSQPTISWTNVANRKLRVDIAMHVNTNGTDILSVNAKDASSNLLVALTWDSGGTIQTCSISTYKMFSTIAAGSQTFTLYWYRSGSSTIATASGAEYRTVFTITDLGPADGSTAPTD